jgi:hypothetical protein
VRNFILARAALALPLETDSGASFPGRDLILFLTFSVILVTLVGHEDNEIDDREDANARIRVAEAALVRLEELASEDWVRDDTVERVHGAYRFRTDRFNARSDDVDDGAIESRSQDYQRLRRELLDAERNALLELRRSGVISNEVWLRVAANSISRTSVSSQADHIQQQGDFGSSTVPRRSCPWME